MSEKAAIEQDLATPEREGDSAPPPPTASSKDERRWTWQSWLPALMAVLGHVLALRNGYVLDDEILITHNPFLRSFDGLLQMFSRSLFMAAASQADTQFYRPVVYVLTWLSWQLFGDNALAHHAVNIVMHAAVALMLCITLQRWNIRRKTAIIVASLFAVHPATADIVAYIGGRHDMIGWLFALGTLALLPRIAQKPALIFTAGALATVLCLFSREAFISVIACFPFAIALEGGRKQPNVRGALSMTAGIVAGVLAVSAARAAADVRWMVTSRSLGIDIWLRAAAGIGLRLVEDLVVPFDLTVDMVPWKPPVLLAVAMLLAGVATLPLYMWRFRNIDRLPFALGTVGVLLALAVVAVHVPIGLRQGMISDRYAYPFLIAAAFVSAPISDRLVALANEHLATSPLRRFLPLVPWGLMLACLPLTWARVTDWQDETTLQEQMERVRPDDPTSKLAMCWRRVERGDYEASLPYCEEYRQSFPRAWSVYRCLSIALLGLGRKEEAIEPLKQLTKHQPMQKDSRIVLVSTLFDLNRLDEIEEVLDDWGPDFANEDDVIAARMELARRRALPPAAPQPQLRLPRSLHEAAHIGARQLCMTSTPRPQRIVDREICWSLPGNNVAS